MKPLCRSIVLALAIFLVPAAAAQEAPLSIKGVNEAGMKMLLAGMAYGIGSANFFLRMEGRGLYCPPRGVLTTPELLRQIAANQLNGAHKPDVIAITAIDGLRKKYPCG
jgi:hypothetical protein